MSNLDTFHSQQFSNEEKSSASNKICCSFFQIFQRLRFGQKILIILSLLLLLFAIYIICFYFYLNLGTEQTIMETLYTIFAINIKEKKLSTPIINV